MSEASINTNQDKQDKTQGNNDINHDGNELSRRDFLQVAWKGIAALSAVSVGYIGYRFLESGIDEGVFGEVIAVGNVSDFALGTVTAFDEGRFFLVRQEDGGFVALYRKCTHLDCVVIWDKQENHFNCPCHGSVFEIEGEVLNPPAPRPLDRFPIEIDEQGQIKVDTGEIIERDTTRPEDVVYPPEAVQGAL